LGHLSIDIAKTKFHKEFFFATPFNMSKTKSILVVGNLTSSNNIKVESEIASPTPIKKSEPQVEKLAQ
jgi:hypothetical protein